ncbi:LysM domain-containing protein [Anaerobacterium chartisolvens]|uniref:LysM domain-containing protein n=1 Tax=Anaerobacterium chartisolvens TaxID=1297424 RepID=A0A369BMQ9_9FIRM|nr:cell wall hydrolase [Anaerobacterium chartisolvens]RCX20964.1 LysM domain-containing protein [Anaerobacterium chartisolvens]
MFNLKRAAALAKSKAGVGLIAVSLSLLIPGFAHAANYNVVKGDSLYTIASLFGSTTQDLIKTNNLSSTEIRPGQVLDVPGQAYTVKSGDSLYLISKRYEIPLSSLRKANNKWDDYIYPGQILAVPAAGTSSAAALQANEAKTEAVMAYTSEELDLLSRLATAEADGEPYESKVAVAAVVLNRVKDKNFPDSIRSVIYQKAAGYWQFTPVENGWINKPASQSSINAAKEALQGRDPSNGALFYFDDSTTNKWLWSKPVKARIGKMVFVY